MQQSRNVKSLGVKALVSTALVAGSLLVAPLNASAQQSPGANPPVRSAEYETAIRGLAEVMGGLYAFDAICDVNVNDAWRLNMQGLLDREGKPGAPIRVAMINAFNEGYKAQQARHPTCNEAAKLAKKNLGARGGQLSRTLARQNY